MKIGDRVRIIRNAPFNQQQGTIIYIDVNATEINIDVLIDGHDEPTPYSKRELKVL